MSFRIQTITMLVVALAAGGHSAVAQSVQPRPATVMRLSAAPVLSIGALEGPDEYLFANINGGALLADGSVVVSDQANFRVQRFDSEGKHLWSRGRAGEGPGEFKYVALAPSCTTEEAIMVYDIHTQRVSVFGIDGDLVDDYRFLYNGLPLRKFGCAASGRVAFTGSSVGVDEEGVDPGELYRELVTVGSAQWGDTVATTLREGVPSSEQRYLGPGATMPGSIWWHDVLFAATDEGVWLGTTEGYEVELVSWTGATIRRIRWEGPDLAVTQADVDRYRDALEESYRDDDDPNWRARFQSHWDWESEIVPDIFPAYRALKMGDDGVLWIQDYPRPRDRAEWFAFDSGGTWTRSLVLPPRTDLLDIGPDRALVVATDDLDVQRVSVHTLVKNR